MNDPAPPKTNKPMYPNFRPLKVMWAMPKVNESVIGMQAKNRRWKRPLTRIGRTIRKIGPVRKTRTKMEDTIPRGFMTRFSRSQNLEMTVAGAMKITANKKELSAVATRHGLIDGGGIEENHFLLYAAMLRRS